jgi:hypothetical protein
LLGTSIWVSNDRIDGNAFAVPSQIFPAAVQLLSVETYRDEILTGFATSAGGLGESLVLLLHIMAKADSRCVNSVG